MGVSKTLENLLANLSKIPTPIGQRRVGTGREAMGPNRSPGCPSLDPPPLQSYRAEPVTRADFQKAGLYDPASPRAAERLEILEWLVARGISVDQMQQADSRGQLPFVASFGVLRPGPYLTQKQLADRLGVPMEVVEMFRVAFALPPVAADAPWCNEAEAEMFMAVAGGVGLFGEKGMLRLARVLGSSVSRIAEQFLRFVV